MLASARALLEHLIDYAGMFPPARLPLREAYRNYVRLAATPESWMLGRFVCPTAQLGELLALTRCGETLPKLAVAALGRDGRDTGEFAARLDTDVRDILSFCEGMGSGGSVGAIEIPVPSPLPCEEIGQFVDQIAPRIAAAGLRAFIEIPHGSSWQQEVLAASEALARCNDNASAGGAVFGLKIRCGAATPLAIPSIADLAFFVARCRDKRLPWKATAGLHHALYHEHAETKSPVHGFLNAFAAATLAQAHALDATVIAEILQERSFAAFRFTTNRLGWRAWDCDVEDIHEARRTSQSFGSCSFDEPRDDLRALGLDV